MSKHNYHRNKGNNKNRTEKTAALDFADYLAFAPGLLMCAMLAIVLMLDIAIPEMAEKQYEDFHSIFTVFDYFAIGAGLLYLAICVKRKELRFEKSDVLFAVFSLLILISTAVNGINDLIIDGVPYRFIGVINMLAFILIYMGVTRSIKRVSFGDAILLGYLLIADLIGLTALYDSIFGTIEAFHSKKELSTIFFNGNHYGYFLVMACLIGLGYFLFDTKKKAAVGAISSVINLLLLFINHSLGCILAVTVVIIATGIVIAVRDHSYGKRFLLLLCALAAGFAFALVFSQDIRNEFAGFAEDLSAILSNSAEGSAGHRRMEMWALTLGYITKKPLLGYGCEGIAFMLYEAMKVSNPHSEVLTYAAYYGIPAAVLYVTGVGTAIITCIRCFRSNGVQQKAACMAAAGYFISSFVGVGMFYTLPFFFIFLGLSQKS